MARKGPLGVKYARPPPPPAPPLQPVQQKAPKRLLPSKHHQQKPNQGQKVPRQIPLPKGPPQAIFKKQLLKKNPSQNKRPIEAIISKPVVNEVNKKPSLLSANRNQKKQGLPADDRFFFPRRNKKQKRPKQKRPNRRPKPKPTTKAPVTYKTTTKAPYKPITRQPSYDVKVTSYRPPKEVYRPSTDVDNFPDFSPPDFPDLSSDFMPNFDFEINKINCKSAQTFTTI